MTLLLSSKSCLFIQNRKTSYCIITISVREYDIESYGVESLSYALIFSTENQWRQHVLEQYTWIIKLPKTTKSKKRTFSIVLAPESTIDRETFFTLSMKLIFKLIFDFWYRCTIYLKGWRIWMESVCVIALLPATVAYEWIFFEFWQWRRFKMPFNLHTYLYDWILVSIPTR